MKTTLHKLTTAAFTLLTLFVNVNANAQLTGTTPCAIPLVVDIQSQDPLCYGENSGWINVDISGGVPYTNSDPYKIRWVKNDYNYMTNITGLMEGDYEVIVIDSVGCTFTTTISLEAPPQITISELHINPTLSSLGSIDLTVTGGVGSYAYEWSNGQITEDITDLSAGLYNVLVTDNNGCEMEETVSLANKITFGGINSTISQNQSFSLREDPRVVLVSPNPSQGSILIQWDQESEISMVRILNFDGTVDKFKKIFNNQTELEVHDLPSGSYRVILTNKYGYQITKALTVL
jgi:hypothetical protein